MAGVRLRAAAEQLRILALGARPGRCSACAYSAAAQQRSTGDQSTTDDGGDDQSYAMRSLEKKTTQLEEKVRDLTESYSKAVADSENVRKRTQKFVKDAKLFVRPHLEYCVQFWAPQFKKDLDKLEQVQRSYQDGIQSFCRDLVEVADILEQAVIETKQKGMDDVSEILCSVEGKLQSVFTKHGLQKMTPVGGDYDPYDHEIVCHVPSEGRRPGSVATIQQDGYKLHGRTIRHAQVGIAVETQQ